MPNVLDSEEIVEGNESVVEDVIRAVDTLLSRHGFRVAIQVLDETDDVPGKILLYKAGST
jgi:hypothetical protein